MTDNPKWIDFRVIPVASEDDADEAETCYCGERENREARAEALHVAVTLQGGQFQEQEVFRADELNTILSNAERIYRWIIGE